MLAHKHEDLEVFGSRYGRRRKIVECSHSSGYYRWLPGQGCGKLWLIKRFTPEGHKFLKKPKAFKIVEDADFEEEEVDETPMRSGASVCSRPRAVFHVERLAEEKWQRDWMFHLM